MRKALYAVATLALTAGMTLPMLGADKAMTWTGWISDSDCGAKGAMASHKACAEKCVKEKGASYVFVNQKTKKVLGIENQDAVMADKDLGTEVKLTGEMKDGKLHVDKIVPTKM